MEKNIATKITGGCMVMITKTHTHRRHDQGECFEHKKDAARCNPMGNSQNNKAQLWKKL